MADLAVIPFEELTLGEEIGRGISKVVFEAQWKGRAVAASRFARGSGALESSILSRLQSSPGLLEVFGAATDPNDGSTILVTELATFGALNDFLEAHEGDLSDLVKLQAAIQIATAVAALHAEKVLHRDLAARNILVFRYDAGSAEVVAKLNDFGMARSSNYSYSDGNAQVPIRWMSPESVERRKW